jgi:cytochrome c oxidase subunit 4
MAEHHGTSGAQAGAHAHGQQHDHPTGPAAPPPHALPHVGWKKYVVVGVILSVVTALEVAAVETQLFPRNIVIPMLVVLTAAKFFLVVLYYMHLKMDHAIFGRVFWAPMLLSVLVVIALIVMFHVAPTWGKFS